METIFDSGIEVIIQGLKHLDEPRDREHDQA